MSRLRLRLRRGRQMSEKAGAPLPVISDEPGGERGESLNPIHSLQEPIILIDIFAADSVKKFFYDRVMEISGSSVK